MARILVIDEDSASNAFIARELARCGHEVESAPNGRTAFVRLAAMRFDLVLTDIITPAVDGFEFTNWPPTGTRPPIIAMSDYGSDQAIDVVKIAMLLGADASLRKPFTLRGLRDAISSITGEATVSTRPWCDKKTSPPLLADT